MRKTLLREIRSSFPRFLSILIMVALGTMFLVGLRSAAPDMQATADRYFDDQKFMDLQIISTLGLTEEDIETFGAAEGVEVSQGGWSMDAILEQENGAKVIKLLSLSEGEYAFSGERKGQTVNENILVEGRMPTAMDECVAEEKLLSELGICLGDKVTLALPEDMKDSLKTDTFTLVGIVESPLYISIERGTSSLGDGKVDAYIYLPRESFSMDYYTLCNIILSGTREKDSYSDDYRALRDDRKEQMTSLAEERADLRYETLVSDAQAELADARQEFADSVADARQEIDDGEAELADARKTLDEGWAELETAEEELETAKEDGKAELADARQQLDEGWMALAEAKDTLNSSQTELDTQSSEAWSQLEAAEAALNAGQAELDAKREELAEAQTQLEALRQQAADYRAALTLQQEQVAAAEAAGIPIDPETLIYNEETCLMLETALAEAEAAYEQGQTALAAAEAELSAQWDAFYTQKATVIYQLSLAQSTIDDGWTEYNDSYDTLYQGELDYAQAVTDFDTQIADGEQAIADSRQELYDGEADYAQGLLDIEEAKNTLAEETEKAQAEMDDAQAEIDGIKPADVYVLDRDANYGSVSYDQNAQRMGNLAKMFPVIFFVVAALVCLTTMTRMVEEQRTEIGSIKAMGYGTPAIAGKFLLYGASASLLGGLIGVLVGTYVIPWIIFTSYGIMYNLPELQLRLYVPLVAASLAAGLACTVGATLWAMLSTARETPAALMRPKAPKAGKRILLERIGPLWRRMSFSVKVSCRNLFRYKKRLFMTILGIAGCTALMIAGLGLRNGILCIIDRQYEDIYSYQLQVSLDTEQNAEGVDALLTEDNGVRAVSKNYVRSVTAKTTSSVDCYLQVTDQPEKLYELIDLRSMEDGSHLDIPEEGVLIDQKLSELLDVQVGDTILLDAGTLAETKVAGILEHYVRHYVYMSAGEYERLFGTEYVPNELLIAMEDTSDEAVAALSEELLKQEAVTSASNIASSAHSFGETLKVIDTAVLIIIFSAAALALVVLYNLTNINITERLRELATLKVLGFYDGETAMYVYRENIVLTLLGILLGQFLGKYLRSFLIGTIEIEIVMFGRIPEPSEYILATLLSLLFALLVNFLMYFRIKKIDMVQSLKSVE
ncbi:MAG: ABC transporter permease [Oscillospiraceae bacterium]|nr:ABC transporter permease [Oscillospiraceae bacterium]